MRLFKTALILSLSIGFYSCSNESSELTQRLLDRGNQYFDNGEYREATILYRQVLQQDPRLEEAHYKLGLAYMELNQPEAAFRSLVRATELRPDNMDAFGRLGDLYIAYLRNPETPERAIQDLLWLIDRAEAASPGDFEVIRIKGRLALYQQAYDKAVALFRQAEKLRPNDLGVQLNLIACLIGAGHMEEAEGLAQEYLERDPHSERVYNLLYILYVRQERIADAEHVLLAQCAALPTDASAVLKLAAHYQHNGQLKERDETLERMTNNTQVFPDAYRQVGDFLQAIGEVEAAIEQYRRGIELQPKEAETYHYRMIEAYTRQQEWDSALELLGEILGRKPDDPRALSLRAGLRLAMSDGGLDDVDTAIADLRRAISSAPKNPVLRFRLGEAYLARKSSKDAIREFREALKISPDYVDPAYALMKIQLKENQLTQASVLAEGILNRNPFDTLARIVRAKSLAGLGEQEQAISELEKILERDPKQREARYQLASIKFENGENDQAWDLLERLYAEDSSDLRPLQGMVDIDLAQGRAAAAAELLRAEIARTPERLELRMALAELARRDGDQATEIRELEYVLERRPTSAIVHSRIGQAYARAGRVADAEVHLTRAMELDPEDSAAPFHLGVIMAQHHRLDYAKSLFEKVVDLNPDNGAALNNLAYITAVTDGDLDMALSLAQKAQRNDPNNPHVSHTLTWIYLKKGLLDQASQSLDHLIESSTGKVAWRYHYARALLLGGEREKAVEQLRLALEQGFSDDQKGKQGETVSQEAGGPTSAARQAPSHRQMASVR